MKNCGPYILVFCFISYLSFSDYWQKRTEYRRDFEKNQKDRLATSLHHRHQTASYKKKSLDVAERQTKVKSVPTAQLQKIRPAAKALHSKSSKDDIPDVFVKVPAVIERDSLTSTNHRDSQRLSSGAKALPRLRLTGYNCDENILVYCVAEFTYGDMVRKQILADLPTKMESTAIAAFKKAVFSLRVADGIKIVEVDYSKAAIILENNTQAADLFTDTVHLISVRDGELGEVYSH